MADKTEHNLTEEEIRPSNLVQGQETCLEADIEFLLKYQEKWVTVPCPSCESGETKTYGEKKGFGYVECISCGTVFTNPRPSQRTLHEFYANSKNYQFWNQNIFPLTDDIRREKIYRPRAQMMKRHVEKYAHIQSSFMEIGAGFGSFLQEVRDLNIFKKIIAVEPTPHLAETCREKGFIVYETPAEEITDSECVDVIASFEVIEHLFSPKGFIKQCYRMLKEDGLIFLSCPNVKGFDVATLGMLSTTFDHEHMNYFHPKSLAMLLETCGFTVLTVSTPGKLDADIVHKSILKGELSLENQPFLHEILVDGWEKLGQKFQEFLVESNLSSHMVVIGMKKKQSSANS